MNVIKKYGIQIGLLLFLYFGVYDKTSNDWDQLPYSACILNLSNLDSFHIHDSVYYLAKKYYFGKQGEEYYELVYKNKYRYTAATDIHSFIQQLPFYKIKPLFIWIGYCFTKFGLDPIQALKCINFLSFVAIGCILCFVLFRSFKFIPSLLLFTTCISYNGLLDMVKELTPDLFSFFLILSLCIAYLRSSKNIMIIFISVIAILVRPENLIISMFIQIGLLIENYKLKFSIINNLISSIGFLILYFLIGFMSESYSWKTLFYHTFIELISFPKEFNAHFTLMDYLNILFKGMDNLLPLFAIIGFLLYILRGIHRISYLLCILFISLGIKFALFPSISERFYLVYIYIICMILCEYYREKFVFSNN